MYAAQIKRAVWEEEARRAEIDPRRHPDYRSPSTEARAIRTGSDYHPYTQPEPLTAEEQARLEKERKKYPVASRLDQLAKSDYEAYKAWQTMFSQGKLAEVTMSDGEFEIMTGLFRRDLRDIERQQMSHSQYVYDIVKAVDPVDLAVVTAMATITAASGGTAAPLWVKLGALPLIGGGLSRAAGDEKYRRAKKRFDTYGLDDPGIRTEDDRKNDFGLGMFTANWPTSASAGLTFGQNWIGNTLDSEEEKALSILERDRAQRQSSESSIKK